MAIKQRTLKAKNDTEELVVDSPQDYLNFEDYDEINDGEITYNTITVKAFS